MRAKPTMAATPTAHTRPQAERSQGVSVVIPVHGNAEALPELCRRLRAALSDRSLQIVMVDDASPDDSLAVMRGLGVEVVAHEARKGQNAAILAGLSRATQPYTCVMDADLEDPPEVVPLLLERLARGDAAVVFSTRRTRSRSSSKLFRWTLRRMFPSLPPVACLFFAMDGRARQALLGLAGERDYLVAAIGALGLPTAAASAARGPRRGGHTAYFGLRRLRYAAAALSSAFRLRRKVSS